MKIRMAMVSSLFLAGVLASDFTAFASSDAFVLKNGRIHTVTRGLIENGMIWVESGKIKEVGSKFEIPAGVTTHDLRGMDVFPGLVDANTRLGLGNDLGLDAETLFSPFFRAVDSVTSYGDIYGAADIVATGVTTVYTAPKLWTWKSVAGEGCVFKLTEEFIPLRILATSAGLQIDLSYPEIKRMRSERLNPPRTQMGIVAAVRKHLREAKNQIEARGNNKAGAERKDDSAADSALESLAKAFRGEIPARIECETENEIRAALDIGQEFGLQVVLERCMEAYRFSDEISRRGIPCVVGPIREGWGDTLKRRFETFQNPGRLARAGVKIAMQAENFGNFLTYPRTLTIEAAWAVKFGLDREEAVKAITINAAQILGVDSRVGSIEKGKDADLVVATGDILSLKSRVLTVIIDGVTVFGSL